MSWPNLSLYPPIRPDTPRPSNKRPRAAGSGVQIVRGRSRLLESGSTPTPLGAETLPRETQAQASAQRVGRIVALASDLGVPRPRRQKDSEGAGEKTEPGTNRRPGSRQGRGLRSPEGTCLDPPKTARPRLLMSVPASRSVDT